MPAVAPQRALSASDREALDAMFTYHAPTEMQIPVYGAINAAARSFAETVMLHCPPGADRSAAMRQIREAKATANASIALEGVKLP